jgi:predicted aconitase with swiveling domain
MILYTAAAYGRQPACMLFAEKIDSLAAAGVLLVDIWTDQDMPTIDDLGQDFLDYVQSGMQITVEDDGIVIVE